MTQNSDLIMGLNTIEGLYQWLLIMDPCKNHACDIQICLKANDYREERCKKFMDYMLDCCEKWIDQPHISESCKGFKHAVIQRINSKKALSFPIVFQGTPKRRPKSQQESLDFG
ncbi:cx9C motif-containing protein 4-like isoform X2 [Artemia franciscana]|uniref:cx9C motif-containing protein 4-like isoform X2 n=1 Tax=Artemia franciscana TaxID=6661 RepID=UPI0032D9C236